MRVSDGSGIVVDGLKEEVIWIAVHEDQTLDALWMVEGVSDGEFDACRPSTVNDTLVCSEDMADDCIGHFCPVFQVKIRYGL